MSKGHIEVAGAGLAGLTAAAALAQTGWSVRVHERSSELREIGAGIFIWENGLRALQAVGALNEALEEAERVHQWQLFDEQQRLIQSDWMQAGGARLYLVRRTDLHRALANAAIDAGVEVVTNSRISGAHPEGWLYGNDGEKYAADLVIGADGINSRVRDSLGLDLGVTDLRDGCSRHLIPRLPEDPEEKALEYWNGGRRVGICPCAPDEVYVYLCCPSSDLAGRKTPVDKDSWTESFPFLESVISRIPDEGAWWASFGDVDCHNWVSGRAVIIGDAAHAMSPNLGQGANVAMAGGLQLAQTLRSDDNIPAALERWQRSVRPTIDATQRYSRFYGRIGTAWPRAGGLLNLRSALVWALGRSEKFQARANVAAAHPPSADLALDGGAA